MADEPKITLDFPDTPEARLAFTIRSEASMRAHLRSKTWEEKVASIVRMREAGRLAREGMRKVMEEKARAGGVSSEACDVKPLA